MKKILFIIPLLLAALVSYGQQGEKHVKGDDVFDTVDLTTPRYYMEDTMRTWWYDNTQTSLDAFILQFSRFPGIILRRCYTMDTLTIHGIAVVGRTCDYQDNSVDSDPATQEYVYLYDAHPDTFMQLAQIPWHNDVPYTVPGTPFRRGPSCCHLDQEGSFNYSNQLREFYFDTPYAVVDSFYVGCSSFSEIEKYNFSIPLGGYSIYYGIIGDYQHQMCSRADSICYYLPRQVYKLFCTDVNLNHFMNDPTGFHYFNYIPQDSVWVWDTLSYYLLVLPIVEAQEVPHEPDTFRCGTVADVRLVGVQEDCAMLVWDSDSTMTTWQVSYGPSGTLPDEGTLMDDTLAAMTLCGLDTCTHYVAYVRSLCLHNDSLYYTDWSDSVAIAFPCDTTTPPLPPPDDSVGVASLLENLTYILPNPANDYVRVMSSFSVSRVEAYDMRGRRVADVHVKGIAADLSTVGWPSGTYVLIVHTPKGMVVRRLAVSHP